MLALQLVSGALAGCVATAPMTASMELMYRLLPQHEQYPLPPSEITAQLSEQAGVRDDLNTEQHVRVTLISHFAYGAAAGAIYRPLARYALLTPALNGIVFGLLVWAVSYLGLLPATGMLRPVNDHPVRRTLLMIVAHIVWGSIMGLVVQRLANER